MGGGKFSWFKPDVIPVVASVAVGCGFAVYSLGRNLWTNPEVFVSKSYRMEGVPESGTVEARASGYKTSIYKSIQAGKKDTRIFG